MHYDLIVIGAGSGGLTAAGFAVRLGAKVALIEKHRIGGECTWTGCIPSKALLKAAKVAHEIRTAGRFGIHASEPVADLARVRAYVQTAIRAVYAQETPEKLRAGGIDVRFGEAAFIDAHTVLAGGVRFAAKNFLICTGASPMLPRLPGFEDTPYLTYESVFDLDRLPASMAVIGAGPAGLEMAQAFQRLGSRVTVVASRILPEDDVEAVETMERVLSSEGVRFVKAKATGVARDGERSVIRAGDETVSAEAILVATGRRPNTERLGLEAAGVAYGDRGITVNDQLRTSARHIYAAGDVTGGAQFTHYAGWQAFQAVRNALLPGSAPGVTNLVPWTTFTDPEVAQIGLTEAEARRRHGDRIRVLRRDLFAVDRAVCDDDRHGFFKFMTHPNGSLLGATIVASRAGEAITELAMAMHHKLTLADIAGTIHAYPTYSTPIQQMAAEAAIEALLTSIAGRLAIGWSRLVR